MKRSSISQSSRAHSASRRRLLAVLASVAAVPSTFWAPTARAQGRPPIKRLTIVVGFPAGGATDAVARLCAEHLNGRYAESVIVDNRSGASGRIGTYDVKRAKPDGSTMLFTPAFPMAIFPHLYKDLPYDTLADFSAVAPTSRGGLALAIGPAVPESVKTLADFVAWCKANPDSANFGTASGSSQHFAGVTFAHAAGINLPLITYKGGAPAVTDMLAGHIASTVSPMPEVLPFAQSGRLRIVATMGSARSRFTPSVPTMVEDGYKDVVFQDWSGLFAPAQTPAALVMLANSVVGELFRSRQGIDALAKLGAEPEVETPDEFAATVKASWQRYGAIVKASGFKVE